MVSPFEAEKNLCKAWPYEAKLFLSLFQHVLSSMDGVIFVDLYAIGYNSIMKIVDFRGIDVTYNY